MGRNRCWIFDIPPVVARPSISTPIFNPMPEVHMSRLRAYLLVPFTVLAFFVRIFIANRDWVKEKLARENVVFWSRIFMVVTVLVWFAIWLYTNP